MTLSEDQDHRNGKDYIANWGQSGKTPGKTAAWFEVTPTTTTWRVARTYAKKSVVVLNGVIYKALWKSVNKNPKTAASWAVYSK